MKKKQRLSREVNTSFKSPTSIQELLGITIKRNEFTRVIKNLQLAREILLNTCLVLSNLNCFQASTRLINVTQIIESIEHDILQIDTKLNEIEKEAVTELKEKSFKSYKHIRII